jgi:phosphatidylinositol glycan class O
VLLWLCAVLAAPLVMVLGFKGPATMLLALLQAAGLCKLLRLRSAALSFICCTAQRSSTGQQGSLNLLQPIPDAVPGAASTAPEFDGFCSVVGAGAWGLMALQLLFCSGHFCEFSGLQYASAFIGFDDMVWYSSGSLLLINTCGFLFLGPLSLPVIMAGCTMLNNELASAAVKQPGLKSCSSSRSLSLAQQVECGLWVMNTMRFAALVASLVSAAVQQQHILLWAIFAPKLVFELSFMVVTAAGQLLVAGLLSYWL